MSENITLNATQIQMLRGYADEASQEYLSQETSKETLKGILEAAAEGTGLEKKTLRKFFKLVHDAKIRDAQEEGETFGFLADQIGR